MTGNAFVALAMFGWIPLVALLFLLLPPARAATVACVAGWLFLPVATFPVVGLPDYSKALAVPLVVFLAIVVFDGRSLARVRPGLVDLPITVYCLTPAVSSLANGLGWYDATTAVLAKVMLWGLPYLIGRIYCSDAPGRERLARALLAGGLIYAPLCLWEIRMSPQLHALVYGYHQHDWTQVLRGGGFRPMVFMNHGLMVALWMAATTLLGFALWRGRAALRVLGVPLWLAVPALAVVTVLCKSFGALLLLVVGGLALVSMRWLRVSLPMVLLLCLPFAWVGARVMGGWSWPGMSTLTAGLSSDRSGSLEYRIAAEDLVLEKALDKPAFGWGGWDRALRLPPGASPRTEPVATDSLWIITFGKYGFAGLLAEMLVLAVPIVVLWRRCPPRRWDSQPAAAVAWGLALALTLYAADNLFNNMENPLYLLIAGGLSGLPAFARARAPARVRPALTSVRPVPAEVAAP
jgi:hypothetical protein